MLFMRMYALYERSRKVLALYIVIGVVIVGVGCESRSQYPVGHSIANIVVNGGQ